MTNSHPILFPARPAPAKRPLPMKKYLMTALASLAFSTMALPAAAANWWNANPSIAIGSTTINVKNKGARGNGSHDDTAAIQAAVNALPKSGGTVFVPAGRYMVNALKPIKLRSHTRLKLDPKAELMVMSNGASRYHVVKVFNVDHVEIVGGKITGDRARHRGNDGEWGYGINISGASNVLVHNIVLSELWGDGMWIGATGKRGRQDRSNYVTINNVTSSHNRRQGMSIGPAQHVYIVNSTFKDTQGTLPEAGIDFEPREQGSADTIRVENNTFAGNHGNGIEMHANVSNVTLNGNTFTGNHGFGLMTIGAHDLVLSGNHATRNGLAGVGLSGRTHRSAVRNNKLQYNSTRYMSPSRGGGADNRDIQIGKHTSAITTANNQLTPNN